MIPEPPKNYEIVELKEGDPRPERYMFRREGFCRGMWMEGLPVLWGHRIDAEHAAKIANGTIAYARPIRKEQP